MPGSVAAAGGVDECPCLLVQAVQTREVADELDPRAGGEAFRALTRPARARRVRRLPQARKPGLGVGAWMDLRGDLARPYLEFIHPEDRDRTAAEAIALANDRTETRDFEIRLLCKDGRPRWIVFSAHSTAEESCSTSSVATSPTGAPARWRAACFRRSPRAPRRPTRSTARSRSRCASSPA